MRYVQESSSQKKKKKIKFTEMSLSGLRGPEEWALVFNGCGGSGEGRVFWRWRMAQQYE